MPDKAAKVIRPAPTASDPAIAAELCDASAAAVGLSLFASELSGGTTGIVPVSATA
ncbi:hypothetical protein [Nocardia stercoris]|uniref:hypothetical protein n=1 Tax=Nocardia stercoris TaxID=2483361 RepID=UPI00131A32AC|nr:hypothetical protein [Nocardia stercoris]